MIPTLGSKEYGICNVNIYTKNNTEPLPLFSFPCRTSKLISGVIANNAACAVKYVIVRHD